MAIYTLPELPYDYAALEPVINPQIIELHHDKHHAAYVKGANDTLEQLEEARDKEQWGSINGLEKNLAFHLSGHILHSIYWHNMASPKGGEGGGEPLAADGVGELADAITESFGSFSKFKAQLTKAAATTQGSGWGVLAYEPISGRLIVEQVYDHQGNVGQGLRAGPRLRRLGARLLPPVQEPEGRLHRRHVAGRELAGRAEALRRREGPHPPHRHLRKLLLVIVFSTFTGQADERRTPAMT
ncbi:superoxide dismutase [Streptomyces filamentosus]